MVAEVFSEAVLAIYRSVRHLWIIVTAPWLSCYNSMDIILSTNNDAERDELTLGWRDNKLAELSYVTLSSVLLAGVITSAFSWYNVASAPWTTLASWFGGLLFAVTAISTATQQSIVLRRLSACDTKRASMQIMMMMFRHDKTANEGHPRAQKRRPSYLYIYIWQVPVMLLNFSILAFLIGLALMVWDAALSRGLSWQSPETKTAALATGVGGLCLANYLVSMMTLYERAVKNKLN